jgi:hypothetical protein
MTEDLIGYTEQQHREISRIVLAEHKWSVPAVGVNSRPAVYPGVCRVILSEADAPSYAPKQTRKCALFELNVSGQQKTIEFSGHDLEGDLNLSIGGELIQVSCKSTTKQLRQKLHQQGIKGADCRATVFPGLWEFDFNGGRFAETPPTFSCVPFEPPSDDDDTPVFSGELHIVNEAWVSVSQDGDVPMNVDTRDWIPFRTGQLTAGAIGAGVWSHEAGWLVLAWQCRDYSFRTTY